MDADAAWPEDAPFVAAPRFVGDWLFVARGSELFRFGRGGHSESLPRPAALAADLPITAIEAMPTADGGTLVLIGTNGAVLRSRDLGQSWFVALLPSPPPLVTCFAAPPPDRRGGALLLGTLEDGVFRSEDGGATWQTANFGLLDPAVFSLASLAPADPADDPIRAAGTASGVFLSENDGRSWRETALPMDLGAVLAVALARTDDGSLALWAGTEDHGLWRSRNGGATWTRHVLVRPRGAIDQVLPANDSQPVRRVLILSEGAVQAIDACGQGATVAETGIVGLIRDSDASVWMLLGDGHLERVFAAG